MPTLKEVAERAGVSITTASRVINDTYRDKVSDATRQRVLQVVAEMDYKPSIAARALRSKRTLQYGLVLPNLAFSYMPEVVQGLQDVASTMEYGCLLYLTYGDSVQEKWVFEALLSRRVDGIIWMPSAQVSHSMASKADRCPVVEILYRSGLPALAAVLVDQEYGGYLAASHVLALGHRHVAIVGSKSRHWEERQVGHLRAFREWGCEAPAEVIKVPQATWTAGLNAAQQLFRDNPLPTAVLAASDDVAAAVVHAAGRYGLRVPQDLSVVGFGGAPSGLQARVPVTTVNHPKKEVGEQAMFMLSQLMAGNNVDDVILQPELIVRSSTAGPG